MKPKQLLIVAAIITSCSKSWSQHSGPQSVINQKMNNNMETGTTEKNKAIVRHLFEDILNKKKTDMLKDVIGDEYIGLRGGKGPKGFLQPLQPLLDAFPDIEWKIEDMMAEGSKVMFSWKWTGTHKAVFGNFPATGKAFTNDGMAVFELQQGKLIHSIVLTDRLGFWQQLGAVPADLSALSPVKN